MKRITFLLIVLAAIGCGTGKKISQENNSATLLTENGAFHINIEEFYYKSDLIPTRDNDMSSSGYGSSIHYDNGYASIEFSPDSRQFNKHSLRANNVKKSAQLIKIKDRMFRICFENEQYFFKDFRIEFTIEKNSDICNGSIYNYNNLVCRFKGRIEIPEY